MEQLKSASVERVCPEKSASIQLSLSARRQDREKRERVHFCQKWNPVAGSSSF